MRAHEWLEIERCHQLRAAGDKNMLDKQGAVGSGDPKKLVSTHYVMPPRQTHNSRPRITFHWLRQQPPRNGGGSRFSLSAFHHYVTLERDSNSSLASN